MTQKSSRPPNAEAGLIPLRSAFLLRWFGWYVRRHQLGKSFHALRLDREGRPPNVPRDLPLVVVLNHASWWDPLAGWPLQDFFPGRTSYAPIEAAMLKKYAIFRKLGFYGVEPGTARGAVQFLRVSEAILRQPGSMIWLTAQGEFVDPRVRPVRLRPGIGHLLRRLPRLAVLPVAIEYVFWTEKTPEALFRFGSLIDSAGQTKTAEEWTAKVAEGLEAAQDGLAAAAMSRNPGRFDLILGGRAGVGGVYQTWGRLKAALTGRRYDPRHGGGRTA